MVANANASDKNLAGTSTKLANGTYTDEVTGSTITVSGGKVTSGTVKGQSIAAFSNKTRSGKVSTAEAYPNKGTIPGESKTITLRSYQSTNTTYSTSDGQSGSFKDGDTIEIGSKAKSDEVVTVTVKGTGADGEPSSTRTLTPSMVILLTTRVTALPARATNIAWSIWKRTVWTRIATLTPKSLAIQEM